MMLFPTDILRAALCCVAGAKEEREYLKGVYITPTQIKAFNGAAAVAMDHGADTDIDAVFLVKGDIPASAEGTLIQFCNDGWIATHIDENERHVGSSRLTHVGCRFPDFSKLLPERAESSDELPMFSARLLALPYQMFTSGYGPVRFKPHGKTGPCQLLLDPVTNHMYGNPFLVIMPLDENAFELCQGVLNEAGY